MKKILFIVLLLSFGLSSLFAQHTEIITLSNDKIQHSEELERANGDIICRLTDTIDPRHAKVSIVFKSREYIEQNDLWVFLYRERSKKELRKSHIFIDKYLKNANTKIEASWRGLKNDVIIWPSDSIVLSIDVERGKEKYLEIPFYIAQKKKSFLNLCNKNILLEEKIIVSRPIKVEEINDKVFPRLQDSVNSLVKDYKNAVAKHEFCTKPKHKHPPLIERKNKYVQRWYHIKSQIESSQRKWPRGSKQFDQYSELIDTIHAYRLDSIFLYKTIEDDCGGGKTIIIPPSTCQYCSCSLETLRKKIDSYYANYSKSGTINKTDWIEIEKIYKCSMQHNKAKRDKENDAKQTRKNIKKAYDKLKKARQQ